jgi:hypothetical protein
VSVLGIGEHGAADALLRDKPGIALEQAHVIGMHHQRRRPQDVSSLSHRRAGRAHHRLFVEGQRCAPVVGDQTIHAGVECPLVDVADDLPGGRRHHDSRDTAMSDAAVLADTHRC